MSLTLDQICELAGVSLDRRCKVLYRLKKNYAHGIITLTEKGHCGSKRCSDVIMRADVAQSYLIQHRNRVKRSLRLLQEHGWMYFLKLKSLVRNIDGTFSCWTKIGETVDFIERQKKYKASAIETTRFRNPTHRAQPDRSGFNLGYNKHTRPRQRGPFLNAGNVGP